MIAHGAHGRAHGGWDRLAILESSNIIPGTNIRREKPIFYSIPVQLYRTAESPPTQAAYIVRSYSRKTNRPTVAIVYTRQFLSGVLVLSYAR